MGIKQDFNDSVPDNKNEKTGRVLSIYTKLLRGQIVNKKEEASRFGVNERSIQRDIDDIRNFLVQEAEKLGYDSCIFYDRKEKGYKMVQSYKLKLSDGEVLALCKILLDSRAFRADDMKEMIEKLITDCVPETNQKMIRDLICNEMYHYVPPRHNKKFIDDIWIIGQAIKNHQYMEVDYAKMSRSPEGVDVVRRKLKPVAIMFSEYYFYLTAFIDNDDGEQDWKTERDMMPAIYRVDRFRKITVLKEHFSIPYRDRFEEGEFRKRIQFMYGGKLRKVRFRYKGLSIEAVLDRLPTARILDESNGVYLVEAEVYGNGIDMWLRSQGSNIQIL